MENQSEKLERRKPRKHGKRSPGYPAISLGEAIQKARTLWEKDGKNCIPLKAVYEHLGYKHEGGHGARIIAALKKFELISDEQDGIKLTKEAVDLVLHEPTDECYIETIRKLALKPSIYEKLFNEYNSSLPSDNTLRIKLIQEYEFNPESVEDFIDSFRKTIEFAGLVGVKEPEKKEQCQFPLKKEETETSPSMKGKEIPTSKESQMRETKLPLSQTEWVNIQTSYPLSKMAWDRMLNMLKLLEPGFVEHEGLEKKNEKEN